MQQKIYKRDISSKIEKYLGEDNIIILYGARQVGKTFILYYLQNLLKNRGKNVYYFDLEDPRLLDELDQGVENFLQKLKSLGYIENQEIYVLIDEIQYLENPSSFLKLLADHYKNIHLVVSGSSSFDIKLKFKDSLVGRTINFTIFNLSFREFLRFREENIVLKEATTNSAIFRLRNLYYEFIRYGGYPKVVLQNSVKLKEKILFQMIDTYIRKDIKDLANVKDLRKFNNLLYVLASRSGKLLNLTILSKETGISLKTLKKYLSILEKTFVFKLIRPFSSSPRVEISSQPKIFFYDSGLLSLLRFKSFQETLLGNVFETNVYSELVKHYGINNLHYWRTKSKQEIDFILNRLPIEVKINFNRFNRRAINSYLSKYKIKNYKIVGLEGKKKDKGFIYPWEISNIVF